LCAGEDPNGCCVYAETDEEAKVLFELAKFSVAQGACALIDRYKSFIANSKHVDAYDLNQSNQAMTGTAMTADN
jgi:hypothetical protein